MPIVETIVAVPAVIWVCNLCGATAQHAAGTGAPLAVVHFIEVLRWVSFDNGVVACPTCRTGPDVAHRILAESKVNVL